MVLIVTTTVVSSLIGIVPASVTPLTTTSTPASICASRWYQEQPDSPSIRSGWDDRLYATCLQANATNVVFSPGICPSGQSIVDITEYMTTPEASDHGHRSWRGKCSERFVISCSDSLNLNGGSSCLSFALILIFDTAVCLCPEEHTVAQSSPRQSLSLRPSH
jgi:hypothetical protein